MTILRSGSNKKYSENWAKAFGGSKKKATVSKAAGKTKAKKSKSKKTGKK